MDRETQEVVDKCLNKRIIVDSRSPEEVQRQIDLIMLDSAAALEKLENGQRAAFAKADAEGQRYR